MYTQFFHLSQAPFSIAPDPRYLFMSERHREALAHLLYGIGSGGGFVVLTGEIGAGKTTICRCLLEQIPTNCKVAYIFNPRLSVLELLQSICEEFRIALPGIKKTAKDYFDALNEWLLHSHAQGRNNVLIIDEAQNLAPDVLEQLRLLTNLETSERKLLQIILIAQPELRAMLARPELEQLAQRVIARYHLGALSPAETGAYIQHRLAVAGNVAASPFPSQLVPRIHALTGGVPRKINLVCDRALLGAYAGNTREVTRAIIDRAATEVFGIEPKTRGLQAYWQYAAGAALGATALAVGLAWIMHARSPLPSGDDALPSAESVGTAIKLSRQLSSERAPGYASLLPSFPALGVSQSQAQDNLTELSRKSAAMQASAASAKPLPDLNGRFVPAMRDKQAAFRLLGQLWGIALKQGDACQTVQTRNVHCYESSGGLAEIRRLDRPAVLTMQDEQGAAHYALLIGLDQSTAILRLPGSGQTMRVGLFGLAKHFKGEFATFWRAPPGFNRRIMQGASGEDVDWLAAQLGKLNGSVETIKGEKFGPAMTRQIRDFQTAQGIRPDGRAGVQTLILLSNAAGTDEPRLMSTTPTLTVAR